VEGGGLGGGAEDGGARLAILASAGRQSSSSGSERWTSARPPSTRSARGRGRGGPGRLVAQNGRSSTDPFRLQMCARCVGLGGGPPKCFRILWTVAASCLSIEAQVAHLWAPASCPTCTLRHIPSHDRTVSMCTLHSEHHKES
jgi:hypothetical protein